jgi:hypothetical protein
MFPSILFELRKWGTVNSLLQQIDAHRGIDRWRQFESVSAHLRNGGFLWPLKHQQRIFNDVNVNVYVGKGRTHDNQQA